MSRTFDYSNYKHDKYEIEKARHKGNSSISFDVFQNKVVDLKDERALLVYVDDFFEEDNMAFYFAEYEGYNSAEEYLESHYRELLEENPEHHQDEIEKIEEQKQIIANYSKRFSIKSLYEKTNVPRVESLTSSLAGATITIPLGEGILDFCYADFKVAFGKNLEFYSLFSNEMWNKMRAEKNLAPKETVLEIKNKKEELIQRYFRYTEGATVLSDIFNSSLYSLINPPALLNQDLKAYERYQNYLLNLQDEVLKLLQFCFDDEFYPNLLGKIHPIERFNLYSKVNKKTHIFRRTEIFTTSRRFSSNEYMPYGMKSDELIKRLQQGIDADAETFAAFAKEFGVDENYIKTFLHVPNFLNQYYECSTVFDMLMLEFTKMLEHNIRFRKCKNCGRYFIMKGNYDTDYCDRIPDGQTKNCQTIASLKNYKEKVSGNVAWSLYNKYYKRYFARMKAGNIEIDVFKKWQYKATAMRDECVEGSVSEQELEDFLHSSFVNRKK